MSHLKLGTAFIVAALLLQACSKEPVPQSEKVKAEVSVEVLETPEKAQEVVDEVLEEPKKELRPRVYIRTPEEGETVASTFTVRFGARDVDIVPAGTGDEGTGHHHLIVNGELPSEGEPMGSDVMHFGAGQTETTLTLPEGTHTLQLMLGDKNHVPHNPPIYSEKVTIQVKN